MTSRARAIYPVPGTPINGCRWAENWRRVHGYGDVQSKYGLPHSVFPTPGTVALTTAITTTGVDGAALYMHGGVDQYELTLGVPDFGPSLEFWMSASFSQLGTPWDGTLHPRPILLHLQTADGLVVVEVTSALVTQNYSSGTACNGNHGTAQSYVLGATISGGPVGHFAPFDIIPPTDPGFGNSFTIFASLATPSTLQVEWWNNRYCFQHQSFVVSLAPSEPGFTQAWITVAAPATSGNWFELGGFSTYCGPRSDDPFNLL